MLAMQSGPKPKGWITLEVSDHLLVGELIGGKWNWECDTIEDLPATEDPLPAIKKFLRSANRARS